MPRFCVPCPTVAPLWCQEKLPRSLDPVNIARFVQSIILDPVVEFCQHQAERIQDTITTSGALLAIDAPKPTECVPRPPRRDSLLLAHLALW